MTSRTYTTSLPATPSGTEHGACSCGGTKYRKRRVEEQTRAMGGGDWLPMDFNSIYEITTWECLNPECRKMFQTERSVGWRAS